MYPNLSLWMVLSYFLGMLWVAIAAVVLWVRWGRGVKSEKAQVAIVLLLIVAMYGTEHWAVASRLS